MEGAIPYMFLAVMLASLVNCYIRPDYNVFLFVLSYILWETRTIVSSRVTITILICWSIITDLTWLIVHIQLWTQDSVAMSLGRIHKITLWSSAGILALKIIVILLIFVADKNTRKGLK